MALAEADSAADPGVAWRWILTGDHWLGPSRHHGLALPFADESLQGVVWLGDQRLAQDQLAELFRVLMPGGELVLVQSNPARPANWHHIPARWWFWRDLRLAGFRRRGVLSPSLAETSIGLWTKPGGGQVIRPVFRQVTRLGRRTAPGLWRAAA